MKIRVVLDLSPCEIRAISWGARLDAGTRTPTDTAPFSTGDLRTILQGKLYHHVCRETNRYLDAVETERTIARMGA